MWCLIVVLLVIGADAFAPAPILWGGLPAQRLVLAPKALPQRSIAAPQPLTIRAQLATMSVNEIPHFTAKPDKTITLDGTGLCVEATSEDLVSLSRCTGGPNQLWDVVPSSGRDNHIRLTDTRKCLDVSVAGDAGLDGATVKLRDCQNKMTESWKFEEPIALPRRSHSDRTASSSLLGRVLMSFIGLAVLGGLSFSAWRWRWRGKARVVVGESVFVDRTSIPLTAAVATAQVGVSPPPGFREASPRTAPTTMLVAEAEPAVEERRAIEDSLAAPIWQHSDSLICQVGSARRCYLKSMGKSYVERNGPFKDDPESVAATELAGRSEEVHQAIKELKRDDAPIRGCKVNPARGHLQALQDALGWTIGGYDTRPTKEATKLKNKDRLDIVLHYRQPEDPGDPPRVCHYDYLCHTVLGMPMKPVGPEVDLPVFETSECGLKQASWQEADWERYKVESQIQRPPPVFKPNRYPYQLPEYVDEPDAHAWQQRAQHWLLWYFHSPEDDRSTADPGDAQIDHDIRTRLQSVLDEKGLERADYIWYRNPAMSVPEVFHVQVFWIVPSQHAECISDDDWEPNAFYDEPAMEPRNPAEALQRRRNWGNW